MTYTLPAPRRNLTAAGLQDRATDIATSANIKVCAGDYDGGAAAFMFTLSAHGLKSGDMLHALWQSAMGAITGGEGTKCFVEYLSANTFTVADSDGDTIENKIGRAHV